MDTIDGGMYKMNNQVLMFFVIFLIVSITPCCAFEINQSTNTHQSLNVIKDDTNKLNLKLAELKVHTDKIERILELYNR